MFIFRSVVGKLWMTIIGLVAVVLIILGLFLFKYIDTSFPREHEQEQSLSRLAGEIAKEAHRHVGTESDTKEAYVNSMNELLVAQETGMALVDRNEVDTSMPISYGGTKIGILDDIMHQSDLQVVFATGKAVSKSFGEYFAVVVPLKNGAQDETIGAIVVYQSKKSVEDTQLYVKKLFALVSFIGFLLTTFFAFFLITRITRPLVQLKQAAVDITQGEYGIRVAPLTSDEIGELANTFNHMGERLEQTVKALNHETENLSSVLRSMADAVISFDAVGNVVFTNPQGEVLLEEWRAIQWGDQEEEGKQVPEPLLQLFENVAQATKQITTKLHVQNGVWSVTMAPLYSQEAVRGAVAVLRDVTEEHRLDKLRKDFVANVSHELRTPLSMLQGYSEALLDDIAGTPEERQELAQVIHDESLRMGRLVRDLLDLARMEAGHMEMSFRETDLDGLLKRVYRKFSVLCKERGIRLNADFRVPNANLGNADEDRLEQVLTNLMDNAIRHTSSGAEITLRTFTVMAKGTRCIQIDLEDQGEGIPPGDLPYIFERFYKADKARTRGTTGTGIGLAIVKNIVEAHQGMIQVKSALGKGTTFSIVLPYGEEA
ncbi:sensor histidine kinase [Paenibacillus contaminans]|uniref:histidine kinase n=1 Tax=Paenibacillus contaminans TaxID=450362 RepID=A0A329MIF8_9BACL|nr:ATP-binding protein [Paenibacillus contaminans]RAV18563.1 two-component sensor histidine kinase [Paenibacillus contaminans]